MNTVINNNPDSRPTSSGDDNSVGAIIGLVIVVGLAILLFAYLLPSLRGGAGAGNNTSPSDSINVDVNVPNPVGGQEGGTGNQSNP